MPIFTGGNPVVNGTLTIVAGCDYKAADGNAAVFANSAGSWSLPAGSTPYLVGYTGNLPVPPPLPLVDSQVFAGALIGPIAGTVTVPTGASQAVSFDLPSTSTSVRPCGSANDLYSYAVFLQLANLDVVPLETGPLNVQGVAS